MALSAGLRAQVITPDADAARESRAAKLLSDAGASEATPGPVLLSMTDQTRERVLA